MRSLKVLGVAALLLTGWWRRPSPAPLPARGPARDSLVQLDMSRGDSVAARGIVEGALALARVDIVYLRAGVPTLYGRDAAKTLLTRSRPAPPAGAAYTWQPLGAELSADHRSAYTYGVVTVATPATPPVIRADRYIAFWEREPQQPWRIVAYAEVGGPAVELQVTPEQTTPPAQSITGHVADFHNSLKSLDSAFSDLADRSGVAAAFAAYVADQGAVFAGPELVVGPRQMEEYYRLQAAGTSLIWTPVFAGGAASEDLGFTVGNYVATGRGPSGAAVQRFGKYLTVWKRQRGGEWKFVIDGGSATPPRGGG